jgi:hypothetical protein
MPTLTRRQADLARRVRDYRKRQHEAWRRRGRRPDSELVPGNFPGSDQSSYDSTDTCDLCGGPPPLPWVGVVPGTTARLRACDVCLSDDAPDHVLAERLADALEARGLSVRCGEPVPFRRAG